MNFKNSLPIIVLLLSVQLYMFFQTSCKKDEKPIAVVTGPAEDILFREAVLTGTFTGDDVEKKIHEFGFEIAETEYPDSTIRKVIAGYKLQNKFFSYPIQNLNHDTKYFCYAWAKDLDNNLYLGDTVAFTTAFNPNATVPTPITLKVNSITSSSALITGEISDDGGATVTMVGFCISSEPMPTIGDAMYSENPPEDEQFEIRYTGLDPETRYYVRAYATNKEGTGYGTQMNFDTNPYVPPYSEWIHYDDGENFDGISVSEGDSFNVAIRFIPEQLTQFRNMYISRIQFFPRAAAMTQYTLRIMTGALPGSENIVFQQRVQSPIADQWNDILLDSPYRITDKTELWIGYLVKHQAYISYPAGIDKGPSYPGYSDLVSIDGLNSWTQLSNFGYYMNWNLQIFVTNELGIEIPLCPAPPVDPQYQQTTPDSKLSPFIFEKPIKN